METFRTDSIWMTAFLVCRGHGSPSAQDGGRRVFFVFNKTPELSAAIIDFHDGGQIPARDFAAEILNLRRAIDGIKAQRQATAQ